MEKTIYKLDTKGNERFLTVKTEGAEVIQLSGMIGTDSPVEHRHTAKAKSVGKKNETTPEEQAILEAEAKIVKKLKVEYFETIEEAKNTKVILPMLAKDFKDEKNKIDWENDDVWVQPKLDGVRGTNQLKELISRKNEKLTLTHVEAELAALKEKLGIEFMLDGELYCHGFNFQANQKMISAGSFDVKFWVYDIVEEGLSFKERNKLVNEYAKDLENIIIVPTYKITSEEELKAYHSQFLEEGYEGTILRWGDAGYKLKGRSSNLLKYKDFIDEAYEIVDIIPCDKMVEWGKPVLLMNDGSGRTFDAGTKLSHEERKELLTNKDFYIGKTAEIRFFDYFDSGKPRFPKYYGYRLDK